MPRPPVTDSFVKVGIAGVVLGSLVWIMWVLVLIDPGSFLGVAAFVISFGTLAALPLALVALRDPAKEGRRVTRLGGIALGMSLVSTMFGVTAVLAGLLNSAGGM